MGTTDTGLTTALQQSLAAIVGTEHVTAGAHKDAVDGVVPSLVVAPGSVEEAAGVLRLASEHHLTVVPRGNGTKLAWGNPPRGADLIVSTSRLNHLLEHAAGDLVVRVQAGMELSDLQTRLATSGQMLALDPLPFRPVER
ncbi:MAG: FAD-binding oxidoreductase, partial [Chloroflexota bacterium]|nr:FAD-binding oxidoreductase [Chloroflexota bacterium]